MILGIKDYFIHRFKTRSLKHLLSLTDSRYPKILALGYWHPVEGIVICKVGSWRLRYLHELGHQYGYEHTYNDNDIMHPWFNKRGYKLGDITPDDFKSMCRALKSI